MLDSLSQRHHNAIPAPADLAADSARTRQRLTGPLLVSWSPGRVNLIGEHTDYNEGYVLPIAIERVVAVAGQVSPDQEDRSVRLYSVHHHQSAILPLDHLPSAEQPEGQPLWALYVAGVLGELRQAGVRLKGFSASIAGDVPTGQGLSSSAALVMATLIWLNEALRLRHRPLQLARLGQLAETRGTGLRVGILDHAASILGRPDQAVLIDCRSMQYEYIPFQLPQVSLFVCDSGIERSLVSSGYNLRRGECEIALAALQQALAGEGVAETPRALRDVSLRQLQRLGGHIPEPARQRAWHVLSENERTLSAVQALREQKAARFGELILASHASLRDNFAVSSSELDALVEIATQDPGAYGARVVGGGFAGGVLIVAPADLRDRIAERIFAAYPARTGRQPELVPVRPTGGPGHRIVPEP